jgi:hypothetical protein
VAPDAAEGPFGQPSAQRCGRARPVLIQLRGKSFGVEQDVLAVGVAERLASVLRPGMNRSWLVSALAWNMGALGRNPIALILRDETNDVLT